MLHWHALVECSICSLIRWIIILVHGLLKIKQKLTQRNNHDLLCSTEQIYSFTMGPKSFQIWIYPMFDKVRALPDITSGPEVWQTFKIWNVRRTDVFLPGCRTFNTLKSRRKKMKKKPFFEFFSNASHLRFFDTKFVSMDLIWELKTNTC